MRGEDESVRGGEGRGGRYECVIMYKCAMVKVRPGFNDVKA